MQLIYVAGLQKYITHIMSLLPRNAYSIPTYIWGERMSGGLCHRGTYVRGDIVRAGAMAAYQEFSFGGCSPWPWGRKSPVESRSEALVGSLWDFFREKLKQFADD